MSYCLIIWNWIACKKRAKVSINKSERRKKGIGPAYADKVNRIGIRMAELIDPETLKEKLEDIVQEKNHWMKHFWWRAVRY